MLHVDPRLVEVPGCSTEQLESLARSIEDKKKRLEADINAYMRHKQHELQLFQQELIAQYRETECGETQNPANRSSHPPDSQKSAKPADCALPSPHQSPEIPVEVKREEKAKRTKVHKRERELFGLVTPIFLPLLDASDTSKDREKKKRQKKEEDTDENSSPKRADLGSSGAEQNQEDIGSSSKRSEQAEMEVVSSPPLKDGQRETQQSDLAKKTKRPAIKKSSLRHSGEKRRRKRVSLVIDGQTVLPADQVTQPQLMSPSETTTSSASNSTVSLEDTLDPRLRGPENAPAHSHNDLMHHSLDLESPLLSDSPTKHTGHTLPGSPAHSPMYESPPSHSHLEYEPPQATTRTYLDPTPPHNPTAIPRYASTAPIYANAPKLADEPEEEFSTYVGGISGSGIDDMDQTGSLGYPSSVGASYMESYMASRPLSVRMAAAEKAGLGEEETRKLFQGNDRAGGMDVEDDGDARDVQRGRDDDDMEIMGSMEDF
ncbi:hypothetical protein BU23DRAFT_203786 [Bimuria novae-zelandiae CBS 107.79]|uniref:Uncharacterized protein n=1 Tax=Bimuria novae-zelandiae CBS 107.79 TaxID=1447943 RepID=A0A6A5V448_9PLEO|nr:hypothetical protein BU23DRAFT_203786 [Bimuria novae-zelandiae CBS 107.79]